MTRRTQNNKTKAQAQAPKALEVASKTGSTVYFARVSISPTPRTLTVVGGTPSNPDQITAAQALELMANARECPAVIHCGEPGELKGKVANLESENAELRRRLAAPGELKGKVANLENENAELRKRLAALEEGQASK